MDDATLASTLMTDAARLASRMRTEGVASERKTSAADLVTAADRACEALVHDALRHERPDDGLLGEEGTADETDNVPGRALVEGAGGATLVVERDDHTWHLAGTPRAVAEAAALVRAA